ncbi:sorting nexin-6-like isoform X1 [Octopus vulgaris]|uniref:Sorting nexin-6-like isoform X1 n=2 Tax=Octopus TaxID=6643 RepID=A0AA36F4G2_OCTVU|nr:sorting nexin-6 [Octopus bimaculoides]XP_029637556.1 sorting nexin-6 isoform X2 [Octopus sinensis]CAI9724039.1 sorting nexin-6-like isoform X1 [Octopus vulgaris]|eukprot:XP_014776536.1 PREDICTED: sorting nexin-6-like [Octopus bimaculoides]
MMDGLDDSPDLLGGDQNKSRSETVDLSTDSSLVVDISDALSERDKVKFTVHTKTTLPQFQEPEFSVVRQHEEFIWLHDRYVENEEYAGIVIPPAPPRPDFDASREKLQRLGEGEGNMTKEEFTKMKQELEAEYLATFKKTVAMHEVFLQRLAAHPTLRGDVNFQVFLEYSQDLSVRGKNKKEKLGGFFKSITKSADEVLLSNQKDVDDFFEQQKTFLVEYHVKIKDAATKSDRMTKTHKNVADCYIQISSGFVQIATIENTELEKIFTRLTEALEKARKLEGRVASDEDLKISDTLRYYMRDSAAAKDLLYRRSRALADYEQANKALDKARTKNKDVALAEKNQLQAFEKFEKISDNARKELTEFKTRRIAYFRKNFVELVELELKHARAQLQLLKNCIVAMKEES